MARTISSSVFSIFLRVIATTTYCSEWRASKYFQERSSLMWNNNATDEHTLLTDVAHSVRLEQRHGFWSFHRHCLVTLQSSINVHVGQRHTVQLEQLLETMEVNHLSTSDQLINRSIEHEMLVDRSINSINQSINQCHDNESLSAAEDTSVITILLYHLSA